MPNALWSRAARLCLTATILFAIVATARCRRGTDEAGDPPLPAREAVVSEARALSALGARIFVDRSLSASGSLACATCHDPSHAFGPRDPRPVQPGGADRARLGHRAVPSLMYLQSVPPFTEHFFDADDTGDDSVDNGPTGGLTWDGRVDRALDQARIPLLSPDEMANADATAVLTRLRAAPYAGEFRAVLGARALDDAERALAGASRALAVYQQDFRAFYPYHSKYDAFLAGETALTAPERRGLNAFEDPAKGNCARCHFSRRGRNGTPPPFTDYGFVALAAPRNAAIPANGDPAYVDLGLCGPDRTDLAGRAEYCGRFRTPTLRNVATRPVFFHNGVFTSLRQVVEFYAERDVRPEKWYPRGADGRVRAFDDLPTTYWDNIDREPPFGGRPGGRARLSAGDIDDIVAFLQTLTDRP